MGMHPRWIKEGSVYSLTQRTVDRQFLFRPDPVVENIIGASAARALKKHPVFLHWVSRSIMPHLSHFRFWFKKKRLLRVDFFGFHLYSPCSTASRLDADPFELSVLESLQNSLLAYFQG
jgi:hypothetical protein